ESHQSPQFLFSSLYLSAAALVLLLHLFSVSLSDFPVVTLYIYPLMLINNDTGFGRRFFVPACLYRDLMLGAHICHSIV
ncbi:MAG: hypothetical protein ACPHUC_03760, partial [Psychrobacter celer]